jgi:iron complex outermembrane recepter protein
VTGGFFVGDIDTVANRLGLYTNDACFPLVTRVQDVRGVVEEDLGYHVQLDFSTSLFDLPLRGNLGVRYVETALDSTGVQDLGDEDVTVTVSRKYSDTLPAVNLVLEPVKSVLLRAAYSKVMSRPALGSLTPGGTIAGFNTPPQVTFGNPNLEPFRADAYDLSAEWYFADEGLVALALFRKDIESFTVNTRESLPWSALGLPDSLLDQLPASPTDIFDVRTTVNGSGGKLEGYEIQYQQPFTFGPAWLRNFGTILNYTHVESKVNFGTEAQPNVRDLNGLSEQSANATLYFENDRFSARISTAYRDDFQRSATGRLGNDIEYTEAATYVDFSSSYKFNSQFKLSFEALNLTDEYREDLTDSVSGRLENYMHTGTQYYLGLQFNL